MTTAKLEEGSAVDGGKVRELRETRGWTRERLAIEAGISYATVGQVERGEGDAKSSTLRALAIALGVTTDGLLR